MRKLPSLFWNFLKNIVLFPVNLLNWLIVRPTRRAYQFMTNDPSENPILDVFENVIAQPTELFEHIASLRRHLLRALAVLVVAVSVSFFYTESFLHFLAIPAGGVEKLVAVDVTESVSVFMRVALLGGLLVVSPYLYFELWLFLAPGLKTIQRQVSLLLVPLAIAFFLAGLWFCYVVMLPVALPFLSNFMGITSQWRPDSYYKFVTGLMFWLGVSFEFPIVILLLTLAGRVTPKMLIHQWRVAIIIIAVISAIITPTVDPVNMALVMAPMIGLYFISILFSFFASGLRKEKQTRI